MVFAMPKRKPTVDEFDSPWKDALHYFLPAFLAFFYPDIHADIDWNRGYVALDKEFQRISRRAKVGKRLADKLFKVWLNDGSERWLLIHVEIQGDYEKEFPQRMFDYHIAARHLYNQNVVSLAVLSDDNASWRPTNFAYSNWGSGVDLTFRIVKLLDWNDKFEELEKSANPFGAVVLAHLQAIRTRGLPTERKHWKLRLVRDLYHRGLSADDVRRLFFLIDWMLALPEELEEKFWEELTETEGGEDMRYISSVERIGMRKGHEQGVREGMEIGIEKGIEKGVRQGLFEGIEFDLEAKFGSERCQLLQKTRDLDSSSLREFARWLKKATTIDEVRKYLDC